jgi:chemotaxis protein CheD
MWVADTPAVVTTILGSCVSVCLWSESVAGISHFILPRGGNQPSGRYGSHALPMLLEKVIAAGATKSDLVAAVFGGASVLGDSPGEAFLGRSNVDKARDFLRTHEIPLIRQDVGGVKGRKLVFRTINATTIVRTL